MIVESTGVRTTKYQLANKNRTRYALCKRGLDIALTLVLLLATAPIMLLVAVLIKLDSPGPVIYRQRRVGMHAVEFSMYKFRSMRVYSDDHIHRQAIKRYMEGAALNEGEDEYRYKLVNDPRVTRVGRFIRKTSLDALPQFWNVLIGQMSLVGPRPPLPYEAENYTLRALERLAGKPGLTGPWQVYARSRVSFDRM